MFSVRPNWPSVFLWCRRPGRVNISTQHISQGIKDIEHKGRVLPKVRLKGDRKKLFYSVSFRKCCNVWNILFPSGSIKTQVRDSPFSLSAPEDCRWCRWCWSAPWLCWTSQSSGSPPCQWPGRWWCTGTLSAGGYKKKTNTTWEKWYWLVGFDRRNKTKSSANIWRSMCVSASTHSHTFTHWCE